ncbi:MAG: hypothetical protein HZA91_00360 [Verrucomicrobia bacterium]|nr:hypothetical protein [Verrucomicrobiota bacterium]
MKKTYAIVLVLVVFLLGVAAGVLGAKLFFESRVRVALSSPESLAQALLQRMSMELTLSDDQRRQIEPVIDDARRDLLKLRDQVKPQLEAIFDRADGRIRPLLTPDQQKRFDEVSRLRRDHWAKFPPN